MQPRETTELVKRILAAYPAQRSRMSAEDVQGMVAAYAEGLADLSIEVVIEAFRRVMRTARFIPTIAELRDAATTVVHGERKAGGEAWGDVQRLIRSHGARRPPDYAAVDPLVAAAIQAFGWRDLCLSEDQTADRARFIELYDKLVKADRLETQIADGVRQLPRSGRGTPLRISEALGARLADRRDDSEGGRT